MAQNPYLMNQIAQGFNFNPGGAYMQGRQDKMAMIAAQYQQQMAQMQLAQAQRQAARQEQAAAANRTLAGAIGLDPSLSVLGPQGMMAAREMIAPSFQPYEVARLQTQPDGSTIEVKEQVINARGDTRPVGYKGVGGKGVVVNTGDQGNQGPIDWTELDSNLLKTLETRNTETQASLAGLNAAQGARQLVDESVFTGLAVPAKEFVALALDELGAGNVQGLRDVLARSQEFDAQTGILVGQIIKLFGSGTGLSDADREFAQRIAGALRRGMTPAALGRILDARIAQGKADVENYNKYVRALGNRAPNIFEAYPVIDLDASSGGGDGGDDDPLGILGPK